MVPPLDISLEIGDQPFRCREPVDTLFSKKMPMIALSGLIIIAQNAFATDDICEPVIEIVKRSFQWFWESPQ